MSNLELDYAHKFSELQQIKKEMRKKDAEIENLKALWYADADPEETAYAEDYYSRVDERDHAAIARVALTEKERMKSEIERLQNLLVDAQRVLEWGEPEPKPVLRRVDAALARKE